MIKHPFKAALDLTGMSVDDLAEILEVSKWSVYKYTTGERAVPENVWEALSDQITKIIAASTKANPPCKDSWPNISCYQTALSAWALNSQTKNILHVEKLHEESDRMLGLI